MDVSIAGELLATVSGMATTGRTVIDFLRSAKGGTKDPETARQLESALAEMKSLNSEFLAMEEKIRTLNREVLRLDEENAALRRTERELREAISSKEEWAAEREHYERKQVGGSWVMVHKGEGDGIYYCVRCFNKGQASLLQPAPDVFRMHGQLKCSGCGAYC